MDTFAERLRHAMLGPPKIKQVELAAACNVKPPSVTDWLNGRSINIEGKNLLAASRFLNVRPEWLSKGTGEMRPSAKTVEQVDNKIGTVPLISWVQAGTWCEAVDNFHPGDAEEWMPCPRRHSKNTYALRVVGESMSPRFVDGDIIMVDPEVPPDSGRFVIAKKTGSGDVTFKQIIKDSGEVYLKAINPQWPVPIIKMSEEWHVCGVIICKVELL